MQEQNPPQCPHLGILDDPSTSHSFPSTWNGCFRVKTPGVPNFEHQEKFCLTSAHSACPVYRAEPGGVFPANLQNTIKPEKVQRRPDLIFYVLGAIALLLFIGWLTVSVFKLPIAGGRFASNPARQTQIPGTPTPATQTPPTAESTITPIATIFASATPTAAPLVVALTPYPLEKVFKMDEQDFLLHRIKDGDGLVYFSNIYHTTAEVIQATNYQLKIPIQAGGLILIRPDVINVDPAEPIFEIYIVPDKIITLDDLAKKLSANLERLKYYNGCADRCTVSRDDWVLIPRHQ